MALSLASSASGHVERVRAALARLPLAAIDDVVALIGLVQDRANAVYVVGNGGSAATATHFASDLICADVRAFSLSDNISIFSCVSNDVGYEKCFEEQLSRLMQDGDALVAITVSGRSPNIVEAMRAASTRGHPVVLFAGFDGGAARVFADVAVLVPSDDYGVVEDAHLVVAHSVAGALRREGSRRLTLPGEVELEINR